MLKFFYASLVFLLAGQFLSAQSTTVRGRILSGDSSVPFATVSIKGTTTATQSDNDGNFTIQATPTSTLVISAVGFTTSEIKVNNRLTITVNMANSANQLE